MHTKILHKNIYLSRIIYEKKFMSHQEQFLLYCTLRLNLFLFQNAQFKFGKIFIQTFNCRLIDHTLYWMIDSILNSMTQCKRFCKKFELLFQKNERWKKKHFLNYNWIDARSDIYTPITHAKHTQIRIRKIEREKKSK